MVKAELHHQAKLLELIRYLHNHPNLLGEIKEEAGKLQILYRLNWKKVCFLSKAGTAQHH
jgi:hypothetical protein